MELTIEQALGDQWAMFYHSQWPVEDLQPVCTLEQSVRTVNQQLQSVRDLTQWKYAHQDEIARLLWVNWMYQRLSAEPIRKPVLVHKQDNKLVVDCGDTRLMSLNLLPDPGTVSVLVLYQFPKPESILIGVKYIPIEISCEPQDLDAVLILHYESTILAGLNG
jgi:hypothetical protein